MRKSQVARWFTGCYVDEDDACFEKKISNSFGDFDFADTEDISEDGARALPVPSDHQVRNNIFVSFEAIIKMLSTERNETQD